MRTHHGCQTHPGSTRKRARLGTLAAVTVIALGLTSCTAGEPAPAPSTTAPTTSGAPTPSPEPTIKPTPPPLKPGNARGRVVFVQAAEDASLVSGGKPIRLTLTRTGNEVQWFSAPPQRLTGTTTTQNMLAMLGWRTAGDGATASLPTPKPQALLTYADGALAVTLQRASVRADGTLVLDVRPVGVEPETVSSFGPVTLTIDGVPGVRVVTEGITDDLTSTVTISGVNAGQALVTLRDANGEIVTDRYLGADVADEFIGDVDTELGPQLRDAAITLRAPEPNRPGRVLLTATLVVDGAEVELKQTLARWTLPKN